MLQLLQSSIYTVYTAASDETSCLTLQHMNSITSSANYMNSEQQGSLYMS